MPQDQNNRLDETNKLEKTALDVIRNETEAAQPASQSDEQPERTAPRRRQTGRSERRGIMYADKTVPRVRRERRLGSAAYSRAYFRQELCLYSNRAQIFFERNYENVNMSLVTSTLVVEAMGGDALADRVSDHINGKFSEIEEQMLAALKELQRAAEDQGIPPEKQVPTHDHKRLYTLPVHTPHSVRFMTLASLFDRIIARTEACWINNIMTTEMKRRAVKAWEKRLIDFVLDLYSIRKQAMEEAKKAGFGRRAEQIRRKVQEEHGDEKIDSRDVSVDPTLSQTEIREGTGVAQTEPQGQQDDAPAPSHAQTATPLAEAPAK